MKHALLVGVFCAAAFAPTASPDRLAFDPDNGGLRLPAGFRAVVVADDLGHLRFMTVGPTGDIYVKLRDGGIWALRDVDGDGHADQKEMFGSGGGTGIAVHDGWLYYSTNSAVLRYRLTPGALVPHGEAEVVIADLPDKREHDAKAFAFDGQGHLLVEVGSPSNALGAPDRAVGAKGQDPTEFLKTHGGFWRFDANRLGQRQSDGLHFATHMRHVLSAAWNPVSQDFFVVMQGRDQLSTVAPQFYTDEDNANLPAEEMHRLRQGAELGWPETYWDPIKKARMLAPEYGGDNKRRAEPGRYADPLVAFPAHWSPLQMAFYSGAQFPQKYRGGAFVAFHGSWNRAPEPQKGYNVAFVPFDASGMPRGDYEVFADGFAEVPVIRTPSEARYRPCGLAVGPEGSLYVADSERGRVWRIVYVGGTSGRTTSGPAPAPGPSQAEDIGSRLYQRNCAICHMPDGSGVDDLQPALKGSAVLAGKPETLIRLLLYGADAALPKDRHRYSNSMPTFVRLTDEEIAALLTNVRRAFAQPPAPPITVAQVAQQRARTP